MGLIGEVGWFYNLTTQTFDSKAKEIFKPIFNCVYLDKEDDNVLKSTYDLYRNLASRSALYAHDIFYAILPVFDASVVGKNYLEAWDSIRVRYAKSLRESNLEDRVWWIDPRWYGMRNLKVLQSFANPIKLKALHKEKKLYVNWLIGDLKLHVEIELNPLEGEVEQDQQDNSIWYFYNTLARSSIFDQPKVIMGNLEKTNEWKEFTFVYKMREELSVRLISASNLYAADLGGTSDPYVQLSTVSLKKITKFSTVIFQENSYSCTRSSKKQ